MFVCNATLSYAMFSVVTNHKSVRMMHVSWVEGGLGFWGCANEIQRVQDVPQELKETAQQRGRRQRPCDAICSLGASYVLFNNLQVFHMCRTRKNTDENKHTHEYLKTAAAATPAL